MMQPDGSDNSGALKCSHGLGLTCMSSHRVSCRWTPPWGASSGVSSWVARLNGLMAALNCSSWKRQLPSCIHASALPGANCSAAADQLKAGIMCMARQLFWQLVEPV